LTLGPADVAALSRLSAACQALAHADHVLLIQNLPIEHNAAALMLLVGSLLGEVVEYAGHGAPVVEIADRGKIVDHRPSSDNALGFGLHTDLSFYITPPEFVAFMMLEQGVGGNSLFCDPAKALETLPDWAITALQAPFKFPPSVHRPDMGPQFFPVLHRPGTSAFNIRFRRDGLEAQNPEQEAALHAFERAIDSQAREISLAPGELTLFSNDRLLHGRRRFRDEPTVGRRRRALRAYVNRTPAGEHDRRHMAA
jgi:alpha-ketoglutarate-dependent taurine dioxygenase